MNKKIFLYEDAETGFKRCFDAYDLGLVKERERVYNSNPEKVIFM